MTASIGASTVLTGSSGVSGTTGAVTTAPTGSIFVVSIAWTSSTLLSIGDSQGNVYTQLGIERSSDLSVWKNRIYYCENGLGGVGHTWTVTLNGPGPKNLQVIELLGCKLSGSLDGEADDNTAVSPFLTPSITTTNAIDMLLQYIEGGTNSNPATNGISGSTPSGGWTIDSGSEILNGSLEAPGAFAWQRVTSIGTYNGGMTEAGASSAASFIMAFKEAAPAVVGVPTARAHARRKLLPKRWGGRDMGTDIRSWW